MATVARDLLTAEQFLQLDLNGLHELVRGEVVAVPPPSPLHGLVCGNAHFFLSAYGRQTGHGYALSNDSAVVTERDPDTVRGADVAYYSNARWPREQVGMGLPPVVPDVVVEVITKSTRPGELRRKLDEYLNAGVPLVIVLHAEARTVALYRPDQLLPVLLSENDELVDLPELPGFRCPVADLFR